MFLLKFNSVLKYSLTDILQFLIFSKIQLTSPILCQPPTTMECSAVCSVAASTFLYPLTAVIFH